MIGRNMSRLEYWRYMAEMERLRRQNTDLDNEVKALKERLDAAQKLSEVRTAQRNELMRGIAEVQAERDDLKEQVASLMAALKVADGMLRWPEFTDSQLELIDAWRRLNGLDAALSQKTGKQE